MDADGLPLIGPGLDFTKIGAINHKRTLAFLNHFICHTAHFLNRFSDVCEEKLSNISVKIQRLETSLSILEAKLSSVPGLEDVTVGTSASSADTSSQPVGPVAPAAPPVPNAAGPVADTPATEVSSDQPSVENGSAEPAAAPSGPTVSQDPRYAKYFKMLAVIVSCVYFWKNTFTLSVATEKVPLMAIKQKMTFEGLDPELLDTPDAPMPQGAGGGNNNSDDDDFSDDDASDGDRSDSSAEFSD